MAMQRDTSRTLSEMLRTLAATVEGIERVASFANAKAGTRLALIRLAMEIRECADLVAADHE